MKPLKDIKNRITQFNVNPRSEMRSKVLDEALELQRNQRQKSTSDTYTWRIIMKSRKAQFTAAAVVVLITYLCLQIPKNIVAPAYALDDTIEASNSVRYLHVKASRSFGKQKYSSESWIEFDEYGRPKRFRHHDVTATGINQKGPIIIVHDGDGARAWVPHLNIVLRRSDKSALASLLLQWEISDVDPKLVCEKLRQQAERGEIILEVNEPDQKNEPIVLVVTYPAESRSANWKKVLYIDQATRLLKKEEKFEMRDGQYRHEKTTEFFDYNQKMDPEMFSLDKELPENVIWVDPAEEVGLSQGNMTDEDIAIEVTLQFLQAVIAKDWNKAGRLFYGMPGFLVKKMLGVNRGKIISVGPAQRDPDPDSNAMISSCKTIIEVGGQYYEVRSKMSILPVSGQPGRWMICGSGTAHYLKPVPNGVTVTENQTDLDEVTYNGLEPGEFMQKWLVLEPIKLEVDGGIQFPPNPVLKNDFATEQIDVTEFDPNVTIGDTTHRWSLRESYIGTVDLGHRYKDNLQITYAWAQVDMPRERQGVLGIGSDDAVKVWLNGELVHENWASRGLVVDSDRVPVTFKKGMNQLVLKIQNHGFEWGFSCRLLDE
jgi:hypothetical protein